MWFVLSATHCHVVVILAELWCVGMDPVARLLYCTQAAECTPILWYTMLQCCYNLSRCDPARFRYSLVLYLQSSWQAILETEQQMWTGSGCNCNLHHGKFKHALSSPPQITGCQVALQLDCNSLSKVEDVVKDCMLRLRCVLDKTSAWVWQFLYSKTAIQTTLLVTCSQYCHCLIVWTLFDCLDACDIIAAHCADVWIIVVPAYVSCVLCSQEHVAATVDGPRVLYRGPCPARYKCVSTSTWIHCAESTACICADDRLKHWPCMLIHPITWPSVATPTISSGVNTF